MLFTSDQSSVTFAEFSCACTCTVDANNSHDFVTKAGKTITLRHVCAECGDATHGWIAGNH
jgi:hypothetical protein